MSANARAIDWQAIYAGRIRAIEDLYAEIHHDMLEWGRWGRERFPGKPRLMMSGVWVLVGEPDPNRDPDAPPSAKMPSFDERRILTIDAHMSAEAFPSLWRKVLHANYVRRLPEYQRPQEARTGQENFIEQLSNALDFLREVESA